MRHAAIWDNILDDEQVLSSALCHGHVQHILPDVRQPAVLHPINIARCRACDGMREHVLVPSGSFEYFREGRLRFNACFPS